MKSDQESPNIAGEGTGSNIYHFPQPEPMEEDPYMAILKGVRLKPISDDVHVSNNFDNVFIMRVR